MAHALEVHESAHHCAACAAREEAPESVMSRARGAIIGWLARVNGTPVADISRGDLGSIRRLAEA